MKVRRGRAAPALPGAERVGHREPGRAQGGQEPAAEADDEGPPESVGQEAGASTTWSGASRRRPARWDDPPVGSAFRLRQWTLVHA